MLPEEPGLERSRCGDCASGAVPEPGPGSAGVPAKPEVRLDRGVADWLLARGGHLLIFVGVRRGCCGGSAGVPVVEAARPHDPWRFVTCEVDGVRVHVERRLAETAAGPLRIGLSGFGPFRRAWVEGLAAPGPDS